MRYGFMTGLRAEAELALRLSPLVRYTASRPDRAAELAWQLIAEGATALVSFGIAGALAPELRSGTLIAAEEIRSGAGNIRADRSIFLRLRALAPDVVSGPLFGSDEIMTSPADKKALYEKSGALAVDMESHIVAAVAQDAGIPFAALRAIADPVNHKVPPAALVPLKDNGTPDNAKIALAVLRRPWQIPDLTRIGVDYFRAMQRLRSLTYIRFLPDAE